MVLMLPLSWWSKRVQSRGGTQDDSISTDEETSSPPGRYTRQQRGDRRFILYEPTTLSSLGTSPLLVLLHGCRQTASGFAQGTGSISLAEQNGVLLVLPEQSREENPQRCWNWFDPDHQRRGRGEPAEIASITRHVMERKGVDPERVFLAGFSAGGAMALVMSVLYPDLYSAVGVHSGVQFGVASSAYEAMRIMKEGRENPLESGTRAFQTMVESVPEDVREVPTVVFHGTKDERVHVENGHQVAKQAFQMNLLAERRRKQINGSVDTRVHVDKHDTQGRSYTEVVYENQNERPLVKKYIIRGMTHAWSGGRKGRRYMDPQGPSALRLMWDFFGQHRPRNRWAWAGEFAKKCVRWVRSFLLKSGDDP